MSTPSPLRLHRRSLMIGIALAMVVALLPLPDVAWGGTPPAPPKPKPITNLTSTSLTLNWEPYKGTATCLQVERRPNGGDWRTMEKCLSPKATSYVVKNMMPGKFYTFKVVAKNGGDKSDSSCRWEVTMLKASASGKKGGTATVTWTGNAGTYILSVMGSGGKVISTKAIPANATSVSFSGLKSGKYSAVMALPASAIPSNALPGETAVTLPFAIPSN